MNFLLILLITGSFVFAHKECCNHEQKKWSSSLSIGGINTSRNYEPTNHHKGIGLDHSCLLLHGPVGEYLDAKAGLAFHTSQKMRSKKISFGFDADEFSLKTTKKIHEDFGAKIGRFASYISPGNQEDCCGTYFIKRPILYRAFFGGHFVDNGIHFDYALNDGKNSNTLLGFETFQGRGLMSKSNKAIGIFAGLIRHKNSFDENNAIDISISYLLNTLYDQNKEKNDHVGCCQGGSYVGKHVMMGNMNVTSHFRKNIDYIFSLEAAYISKLADKYGRNNHHMAYNASSVIVFNGLPVKTIELGMRYDHLRGINFCSSGGAYCSKKIEKTVMIGWKPIEHHTLRFEYTNQTLKKEKSCNVFQVKYTVLIPLF